MNAIIFHKNGKRVNEIRKKLGFENIYIESRTYIPAHSSNIRIADTNMILIKLDSPDTEILALLPILKQKWNRLPIVVLDEQENTIAKQRALQLGADAYFSKPFYYRLLAIHLKNLACRKESYRKGKWVRALGVCLDMERRFVRRNNRTVRLRNKEFSLLEYLIINRGKLLTRNSILEHVWDRNANFASNTVDVHINRLRQKIDAPYKKKLIHTVPCVGYMFDEYTV